MRITMPIITSKMLHCRDLMNLKTKRNLIISK